MQKIERKPPKVIAHRGAKREAPENSIQAFEKALNYGCDGIEFDVLLTKDKVPIVTHNNDLSILTHFDGFAHTTPFSLIKSLDFGSHFRLSCSDVRVSTLTEVLELLQPHDIKIICEIKTQPGMSYASPELVSGIISDFRFMQPLIISSSDLKILGNLKRISPKTNRGLIIRRNDFSFIRSCFFARLLEVREIHAELPALSKQLVRQVEKHDWKLSTWTVNTLESLKVCLDMNVDSIITDNPKAMLEYFG